MPSRSKTSSRETQTIDNGGTYAPFLGCHALQRGYTVTLYTWDLMVFDPSWFAPDAPPMIDRLAQQAELKTDQTRAHRVARVPRISRTGRLDPLS